ncbi:hypothetical protein K501DRAFT_271393 [Backusella circina FSU 941]|nr:hypothetical protein K501DRAFT_271393 [Backusella circina FSU 941]
MFLLSSSLVYDSVHLVKLFLNFVDSPFILEKKEYKYCDMVLRKGVHDSFLFLKDEKSWLPVVDPQGHVSSANKSQKENACARSTSSINYNKPILGENNFVCFTIDQTNPSRLINSIQAESISQTGIERALDYIRTRSEKY